MTLFRRHLRFFAAIWILFQTTSLSALVPRACCLVHETASARTAADCHQESTDAQSMHHMRRAAHQHSAPSSQKPPGDCAIRGTCGGPLAAMFAIFSTQGVLTERIDSLPVLCWTPATVAATAQLIGLSAPPDAPPPRA